MCHVLCACRQRTCPCWIISLTSACSTWTRVNSGSDSSSGSRYMLLYIGTISLTSASSTWTRVHVGSDWSSSSRYMLHYIGTTSLTSAFSTWTRVHSGSDWPSGPNPQQWNKVTRFCWKYECVPCPPPPSPSPSPHPLLKIWMHPPPAENANAKFLNNWKCFSEIWWMAGNSLKYFCKQKVQDITLYNVISAEFKT